MRAVNLHVALKFLIEIKITCRNPDKYSAYCQLHPAAVIDTCIRPASEGSQPFSCVAAPHGRSRGSRPRTLAARAPDGEPLGP